MSHNQNFLQILLKKNLQEGSEQVYVVVDFDTLGKIHFFSEFRGGHIPATRDFSWAQTTIECGWPAYFNKNLNMIGNQDNSEK